MPDTVKYWLMTPKPRCKLLSHHFTSVPSKISASPSRATTNNPARATFSLANQLTPSAHVALTGSCTDMDDRPPAQEFDGLLQQSKERAASVFHLRQLKTSLSHQPPLSDFDNQLRIADCPVHPFQLRRHWPRVPFTAAPSLQPFAYETVAHCALRGCSVQATRACSNPATENRQDGPARRSRG